MHSGSKIGKQLFETIYLILAIAYLFFPLRWAAWLYSYFVLFQMVYHWNMEDSWLYIGKFILVWAVFIGWMWFVIKYRNKV